MSIRCSSDRCCFFRFFLLVVVVVVADGSDFEVVAADVVACSFSFSLEEGKRQNINGDHLPFVTREFIAGDRKKKSHVVTLVTQNKRSTKENDENRLTRFRLMQRTLFNSFFLLHSFTRLLTYRHTHTHTRTVCEKPASYIRSVSRACLQWKNRNTSACRITASSNRGWNRSRRNQV